MNKRTVIFHLPFLIAVLIQLYSSWTGDRVFEYGAKPFILAWIMIYFLLHTRPASARWLAVTAFLFSWIGDILLMFAWRNELFFFAGIGGFFFSQIFFILAFLKYSKGAGRGLVERQPVLILPFLILLAGLFLLIYPGLQGVMKPVVFIYSVSIIGMAVTALNRYSLTQWTNFWLTFSGAVLFILSDSLLAYNKFITEIPKGGFLIMLTYIAAQYLIMRGLAGQKAQGTRLKAQVGQRVEGDKGF